MTAAMFDPLAPGGGNVVRLRPAEPEWRVIMPVPEGAPAPPAKHPKLGAPAIRWEYRDAAGHLLGLVCRFNMPGGGKEIRSHVFAEHKRFGAQWRWLGFPRPRPIYGLDRLAARPDAPVIVCEGEKAADAAGALLPDHVAITSPGGSKAAKAADWSALAGRRIVIWPDADPPGEAYAGDVLDMLAKLSSAPSIAIVKPPDGVAAGWDMADAVAEGWTAEQAAALLAEAQPAGRGEAAEARGRKPNTRDWLIELIGEAELWHDPERIAYATVPVDGHRENFELGSERFKDWLADRACDAIGLVPAAEAIEATLRIARAKALRGPCCRTWRRVAEHDDGRVIYLDLGCPRWRAVKITAMGWKIVDSVPVKFLRSRGMETLPEPEAGEPIELLREFCNVESDADFRLFVAWLAAALRPAGPFPILILTGQQGAAKSTLARIARLLIDPNASPIRSVPKDERDLIVSAFNSWLLVYDNLSAVPAWLSDALCRLSTGGGFATRQLHSDRDETIFAAQRPIVLNGIGDLAARPDLADRVLSITLPPIADDQRREEREFWAAFMVARPAILGALCDIVAGGLRRLPDIKPDRLPRMADFARWGAACAPGWGSEPAAFLRDYDENRSDAMAVAAEASPLVPAIEAVLGRARLPADGFDGTAAELLDRLGEVCSDAERRARWYPANAAQVGSALRRIAPLLRSRGIKFLAYKDRDKKRTRRIVLSCISEAVFDELRARVMGGSRGDNGNREVG
jgi:putative DNA primase/helicase